jgi:hypothetical protein
MVGAVQDPVSGGSNSSPIPDFNQPTVLDGEKLGMEASYREALWPCACNGLPSFSICNFAGRLAISCQNVVRRDHQRSGGCGANRCKQTKWRRHGRARRRTPAWSALWRGGRRRSSLYRAEIGGGRRKSRTGLGRKILELAVQAENSGVSRGASAETIRRPRDRSTGKSHRRRHRPACERDHGAVFYQPKCEVNINQGPIHHRGAPDSRRILLPRLAAAPARAQCGAVTGRPNLQAWPPSSADKAT